MKKPLDIIPVLLILLTTSVILSAFTGNNKKQLQVSYAPIDSLPVRLPQATWYGYLNGMNIILQQLEMSDLQSKNVKYMRDSIIIPMQTQIYNQLQKQLAKDTVGKKPK